MPARTAQDKQSPNYGGVWLKGWVYNLLLHDNIKLVIPKIQQNIGSQNIEKPTPPIESTAQ